MSARLSVLTRRCLLLLGCPLVLAVACGDSDETSGSLPTTDGGLALGDAGTATDAATATDGATPTEAATPEAAVDAPTSGCAVANGGCGPNATCSEPAGKITCTCKDGFVGDGGTCADVAATLVGLRWELPCTAPNANASLCGAAAAPVVKTATLSGAPGTTYAVTLRFRGIIEPNAYSGGSATGFFYTGGAASDPYANIYELKVSAPVTKYFVNAGTVRPSNDLYCETIDYTATVDMTAGATVTLTANPRDALQIKNRNQAGTALVVPNVPPAPAAFDGQFVQMDVVSIVAK